MSFIKFVGSREFFKQLGIAILAIVIIGFLALQWLKSTTNHGDFVEVPDLTGKSLKMVQMELDEADLSMEIQDSANYNPKYPKYSVIEQYPEPGAQVKEYRKIALTLNPSGYRKVPIPDVLEKTFRQAKPTLEAVGFQVGNITYVDNMARDLVLGIQYEGKKLKVGDYLPLTSKIDLVLGNGNN
ncbi:PASTA domain-containing protein [Flavobacteriaceae bacterium MAR_2010_188]|nr:PASTA domain-containing protein [Flavobacteriaceae bacterium MAR_2010_188]